MAVIYAPAVPDPKWSEYGIAKRLATDYASPFHFRKNYVVIPNLTTFISWEADLIVCSKAGYLTEIEIKVSAADWMNDQFKKKWTPNPNTGNRRQGWEYIKRFYYAAPPELAVRWNDFGIPDFAGVIAMDRSFTEVKPAKQLDNVKKLSDKDMNYLTRLTAMRIWR